VRRRLASLFDDRRENARAKIAAMLALLALGNLAAWALAFAAFRAYPALLGMAAVAYSFGLRHAFDADHIAAIDNVTRKLMQEGKRPVGVGLFFSLGHSAVVVALSVAIAFGAGALKDRFETLRHLGAVAGALVSATFLFAIAAANLFVLASTWRAFRAARAGSPIGEAELERALVGGGLLSRLYGRVFRRVDASWRMFPVGMLFGLGFDTATEIGLIGLSAAGAARGMPIWSILIFPALFTAGMTLLDAADSALMLGAYEWAFVDPARKLYYNLTITAASILAAVLVGGVEALNIVGDRLGLSAGDGFFGAVGAINANFGWLGVAVAGVFALAWGLSALVYRLKGFGGAAA
jgi:nickel/cobalt transporter (NiCoT) family protein